MIEKIAPDKKRAIELLDNAAKDLQAAGDNLKTGHPDWALAISYNAMLSAGMALRLLLDIVHLPNRTILLSSNSARLFCLKNPVRS